MQWSRSEDSWRRNREPERGVEMVRDRVEEAATELSIEIKKESKTRQENEQEVVKAVKHYTAALQDGVRIVGATQ